MALVVSNQEEWILSRRVELLDGVDSGILQIDLLLQARNVVAVLPLVDKQVALRATHEDEFGPNMHHKC